MQASLESSPVLSKAFDVGGGSFVHRGASGRGPVGLSVGQQRRHAALVRALLPEDAARWLERGSLASGRRP
jgi:hypothetical protein